MLYYFMWSDLCSPISRGNEGLLVFKDTFLTFVALNRLFLLTSAIFLFLIVGINILIRKSSVFLHQKSG